MEAYSCTDETFDNNLKSEYRLSIQVGLDGFSFCILDETRKKYIVFKHEPFVLSNYSFLIRKLNEIFDSEEMLHGDFKHVAINFNTPAFTFAPVNEEITEEPLILNLNVGNVADGIIHSFDSGLNGIKVIFAIPETLHSFFYKRYKEPVFSHFTRPLFAAVAQKFGGEKPVALLIDHSRNFTLVIYNGKEIIFANSFHYRTDPDFNFFLTASFRNLAITLKDIVVYLAGDISYDSIRFKFLHDKFKSAEFLKLSNDYQYSYTFSQLPQHRFLSVINPDI